MCNIKKHINFIDILKSLAIVVKSNLFSYLDNMVSIIFTVIVVTIIVAVLFFTKKNYVRMLAVTNIVTWVLCYFAVKTGFYSYGYFGSRYSLFFIPLWIITLFCCGIEIYEFLIRHISEKKRLLKHIYSGFGIYG